MNREAARLPHPAAAFGRASQAALTGSRDGQPLGQGVRAQMEERLGHDFSAVRIHTDTASAQRAAAVGASAFTVGTEVFFGRDQFRPGTQAGRRLLAHELAHTLQPQAPGTLVSGPANAAEAQAERMAREPNAHLEIRTAPERRALIARQSAPAATLPMKYSVRAQEAITLANERAAALVAKYLAAHPPVVPLGDTPQAKLARAFMVHNPGSFVDSQNGSVIAVNVKNTAMWQASSGHLSGTFPKYFSPRGIMYFVDTYLVTDEDSFRWLLWLYGHVPKTELALLLDSAPTRMFNEFKEWFFSFDSEYTGEAPWVVQFIADLNPLTSVAKLYDLAVNQRELYSGEKVTTSSEQLPIILDALSSLTGAGIAKLLPVGTEASKVLEYVIKDDEWLKLAKEAAAVVVDGLVESEFNTAVGEQAGPLIDSAGVWARQVTAKSPKPVPQAPRKKPAPPATTPAPSKAVNKPATSASPATSTSTEPKQEQLQVQQGSLRRNISVTGGWSFVAVGSFSSPVEAALADGWLSNREMSALRASMASRSQVSVDYRDLMELLLQHQLSEGALSSDEAETLKSLEKSMSKRTDRQGGLGSSVTRYKHFLDDTRDLLNATNLNGWIAEVNAEPTIAPDDKTVLIRIGCLRFIILHRDPSAWVGVPALATASVPTAEQIASYKKIVTKQNAAPALDQLARDVGL